jgi:hypothetical protein
MLTEFQIHALMTPCYRNSNTNGYTGKEGGITMYWVGVGSAAKS